MKLFFLLFFQDSDDPVSPAFTDFDGIFNVLKLAKLNSIFSNMPSQSSFTFQFKRKKLSIEKIHLPPESSIIEDNKSPICSTIPNNTNKFDF